MKFACFITQQTTNYGRSMRSRWYAFRIDSKLSIAFHFNTGNFEICQSLFNNVRWLCRFAIVVVQQQIISPICTAVGTVAVDSTSRATRSTTPFLFGSRICLPTNTPKRSHCWYTATDHSLRTALDRNTATTTATLA